VLISRWRRHGDIRAREEVIVRFLPLARRLARRYVVLQSDREDLYQVATLGLLQAIDRFEPEREVAFESFAIPTILGVLKRHFRDSGWAAHVPRRAQELALSVEDAAEHLRASFSHSPRVEQIAQYLELSTEEVLTGLNAATAQFACSLEVPVGLHVDAPGLTLGEMLGSEDSSYAVAELILSLAQCIASLPARQRQALEFRMREDLFQSEIAERMGCSQMQVSRLLRQAATGIRAMMEPSLGRAT
jgi:RNA polymerase sigma-B factor